MVNGCHGKYARKRHNVTIVNINVKIKQKRKEERKRKKSHPSYPLY